ncbi:MAG: TerB family tellurite resistance protein [Myxococcota bacterium]|nr:TerB family tellurite resistance protein [Myxococcota bacterium]
MLLDLISVVLDVVDTLRAAVRSSPADPGSTEQERARNPNRSASRELGKAIGLSPEQSAAQHRLAVNLTSLLLDVARTDGVLDPAEADEAQRVVWRRLDLPETDRRAMNTLFRETRSQGMPAERVARELASQLSEEELQALVEGLYRVAAADGAIHRAERARLRHLCGLLGVSEAARRSAVVRTLGSVTLCYELLDVAPDVSDLQLKDAYLRRSLETLGAQERDQVETAFHELRRLRGMD